MVVFVGVNEKKKKVMSPKICYPPLCKILQDREHKLVLYTCLPAIFED
jgi:hypothetical protein